MQIYHGTQHDLAALLEQASRDGGVRIQREDGQSFILRPEDSRRSPLDVEGIDLGISTEEIVEFVRQGRGTA